MTCKRHLDKEVDEPVAGDEEGNVPPDGATAHIPVLPATGSGELGPKAPHDAVCRGDPWGPGCLLHHPQQGRLHLQHLHPGSQPHPDAVGCPGGPPSGHTDPPADYALHTFRCSEEEVDEVH